MLSGPKKDLVITVTVEVDEWLFELHQQDPMVLAQECVSSWTFGNDQWPDDPVEILKVNWG